MEQDQRNSLIAALTNRLSVRTFAKSEDGTVLIFGLFLIIIMMVVGGMAVDFMRTERERALIQYTTDRAILAGAALSQPLDTETVIRDYFAKANLEPGYDLKVAPKDSGLNYRTAAAKVSTEVYSFFLNMGGIDSMTVKAAGRAEERIPKVEISLVLDVSGSMGRNNKLQNMQDAAVEFVNTVLIDDHKDLFSVSLVPYNMQVNVGEALMSKMNVTDEHNKSHCIDFTSSDFNSTAVNDSSLYQRTGHFDPFYHTIDHPQVGSDDNDTRLFMCPPANDPDAAKSEIVVMEQNITTLTNRIRALQAGGNTSIDIGVKWGAALLDPASNTILTKLTGTDAVDGVFANRPAAYSDKETIKVMVVMTDGVNTGQYTLKDDYNTKWNVNYGELSARTDVNYSNVWYDPNSDRLSVYHAGNGKYRIYKDTYDWDGYWADEPYDNDNGSSANNAKRLTWAQVWDMMGTKYNAYYLQYPRTYNSGTYYGWLSEPITEVTPSVKNARMDAACTAAKDKKMVVFAIGFEISDSSAALMEKCASSKSHFFRVEGVEIKDAFSSIANTIQRLKLTN